MSHVTQVLYWNKVCLLEQSSSTGTKFFYWNKVFLLEKSSSTRTKFFSSKKLLLLQKSFSHHQLFFGGISPHLLSMLHHPNIDNFQQFWILARDSPQHSPTIGIFWLTEIYFIANPRTIAGNCGLQTNTICRRLRRLGFATESSTPVRHLIGDLGTVRTCKLYHHPTLRRASIEAAFPNIQLPRLNQHGLNPEQLEGQLNEVMEEYWSETNFWEDFE